MVIDMMDFTTKTQRFGGSIGIIIPSNNRKIVDIKEGEVVKVTIQKIGDDNEATAKH